MTCVYYFGINNSLFNVYCLLDRTCLFGLRVKVSVYSWKKISKVELVNSYKESLIQLADLVVGSILRTYQSNKSDSQRYREILGKRIEDVRNFS